MEQGDEQQARSGSSMPVVRPVWEPSSRPPVRVRRVRTIRTAPEGIQLLIVKVETEEPGLYGLGCATSTLRTLAVAEVLDRYLAPLLVGRDVDDIEDFFQLAHVSSYWRSGPILNSAISGIDMALWDIKGKRAGMPLYQLFGGRTRRFLGAYGHAFGTDRASLRDAVQQRLEEGFSHVRCQMGIPGSQAYGSLDEELGALETRGSIAPANFDALAYSRLVPAMLEFLRAEFGGDVELLHDVHERLTPVLARQVLRDVEPYRPFFLEDVLAPEDLDYLPELRWRTSVPLAIGELFSNPREYVPIVRDRLIDYLRVHVAAIGGLSPALKLARFAELCGVRTAWHGPGDVSPVGHAANLHLGLSSSNFGIHEPHAFSPAAAEVFPGTPEVRDGAVWSNEQPGLGIDLDEQLAARYPYVEHPVGNAWPWPPIRATDGSVVRP